MIVVRTECIGTVELKLVTRPTNTCIGVDNYSIFVNSPDLKTPVIRHVGCDPLWADMRYQRVLVETQHILRQP